MALEEQEEIEIPEYHKTFPCMLNKNGTCDYESTACEFKSKEQAEIECIYYTAFESRPCFESAWKFKMKGAFNGH